MGLITLTNISVNFLERSLFKDIGLQVETGERIGLVGPNGSGKTSLLRIITGEMPPDHGEIKIAKGCRTGYLPQDIKETESGVLLESVLNAIDERAILARKLKAAESALEKATHQDAQRTAGEEISHVHQKLSTLEDNFPAHLAEKILLGLGFTHQDFDRSLTSLSGGWKMRAALAKILYQKPDLLLLDEPTNHLDIPSVRWLEDFLKAFSGAMILVSHDREFLNRQVGRIISFEPEGIRSYQGNYDAYLKIREEENRTLEANARKQEQKIKDAQKFIDRFRAKSSKARQAQSKIKLVKKMALVQTHQTEKTIHFSFPDVERSGRNVLALKGLHKAFGKHTLYKDLDLNVLRGERIAVVGPNGCGKTTLLKLIAGQIEPTRGTVSLGHKVDMTYFAQHHADHLNLDRTVIEEVYQAVPDATIGFVRSVCGAFLFSGNDVDKPIHVLSGGERARVSLAKILVSPGNFMLMDEPTNHLDISSSEMLIEALAGYNGTLIFVSHNQYFVNKLATKIWDIQHTAINEYPGNLDEYFAHLARIESCTREEKNDVRSKPSNKSAESQELEANSSGKKASDKKKSRRERALKRQRIYDTLKPIQDELKKMEDRITHLETRQKEVEKSLADPKIFEDKDISVPLLTEYKALRDEIQDLLSKWEASQNRLESAKTKLGVEG